MKIVQLSDLHLVAPGGQLFGSDPLARLDLAIADICARHADADFCLLTGDLADAGGDSAYQALAARIARLPMPCRLLPGNHDSRATLRRCIAGLPDDGNGFIQAEHATAAGRFLLLDTLEAGKPWGRYCAARRDWLAARLAAAAGPVFIAMHHPPFACGIPSMDRYALRDGEAFREIIAPHRNRIRHIFLGHLHRPLGGSWHGIPFSCTASPNHQVALDLESAGDDVPGCREPAGYSVALIDDERVVVHHAQLFNGETAFRL
jgi:3',5'-cyclic AMP phosphodiesterase CpdA